ncbi:MAG: hypothetical protein NT094_03555 [Candidatus Staskawiczbacteria bacterium]|nr:hypothetical protein [Candidatus Staskawiczbacteria bacterium]
MENDSEKSRHSGIPPKAGQKAWVIAADMGYGHQRTAYPLRDIAFSGRIIRANNYVGIPDKDKNFWYQTRSAYEFISRFKRIPFLGDLAFSLLDIFQICFKEYFLFH